MAEGGRRLAHVLEVLSSEVEIGMTTKMLDEIAFKLIEQADAKPAFLGYKPYGTAKAYPFTLCASVNNVVVHGLPSEYEIKNGDLIKLDLGLKYMGFYLDSAVTVGVGNITKEVGKLINVTRESLYTGIAEAYAGKTVGDIGFAVQKLVEKNKFSVVRSLTGHGIGRNLHEDPQVLNFGKKGSGEELEIGMVVAIEPMVNAGAGRTEQLNDDSFITADGSLSAHFEHTVAITNDGPMILTEI